MKSSFVAFTLVSSLLLSGCFRNNDGCSSCVSEEMCATCPSPEMMNNEMTEEMMMVPEQEEVIVVGQNTPITELSPEDSEK